MKTNYLIRNAEEKDCEQIMKLIMELAEFEKMPDQVHMTVDVLKRDGFGADPCFHCLVAESTIADEASQGSAVIGYCLHCYMYSTWEGKMCYMDDLYVNPQWRSKGVGTALWVETTKIALSKGCNRFQWSARDWNTGAMELYKRRGGINLTQSEGTQSFRFTKPLMQEFVKQCGDKH